MKRRIGSLILSLSLGIALLVSVGFLVYKRQTAEVKPRPQPSQEQAATEPQAGGPSISAVQLTLAEQQKIGLQVEEVRREPAGAEIVTSVPRTAVLDTGGPKIVYVAQGDGIFEKRPIEVGTALRDRYPVARGLKEGERVVTKGAFMVYSQSQLTGGMTGLFGGSKAFGEEDRPSHNVAFRIEPDPPVGGRENNVHVTVTDPSGKIVGDAQVHMTLIMPAMPSMKMPEMRAGANLQWNGKEYTGPISVSMAGPWNIVVEAKREGTLLGTYRSHVEAR
jgi:hypothetical protein